MFLSYRLSMLKKVLFLFFHLLRRQIGKVIFVNYFNKVDNVGDQINIEIVKHYTGKRAVNAPGIQRFRHGLIVGSIVHTANKNSVIIGSGVIHPSKLKDQPQLGEISALRGELSKNAIEKALGRAISVPLGDPALLMPRIFNPPISGAKYNFGVVLHYADFSESALEVIKASGGKVILVSQPPKKFIEELVSCHYILSSSLHGLILADAYNVPNKWIVLSDDVYGNGFKFKDYYSTTNSPNEKAIHLEKSNFCEFLEIARDLVSVKKFNGDLDELDATVKRSLDQL